jgi:hypothetical protein
MKEAFYWVKKCIASVAKFLIAILSCIVDAMEPDQSSGDSTGEGHLIKSAVISINNDGLIFLKAVNGVVWHKYRQKIPPLNADSERDAGQGSTETMQFAASQITQIGSDCYLIKPYQGGHTCTPVPCPV